MFKKQQKQGRRRPVIAEKQGRNVTTPVFSYNVSGAGRGQGGSEPERPVEARQPRPRWYRRWIGVVGLLVILAVVINNILITKQPVITVAGDQSQVFLRDLQVYQDAAREVFNTSLLNKNKLTVDTGHIRGQLLERFPELADIAVTLPLFGRQPTVYIQPSTSRLLLTASSGAAFILDASGKAIVEGDQAVALRSINLPEVNDQSGLSVQLGTVAMPSTNIAFITEVARQLKAKNIAITSMTLPAGNNELHVRLQDRGYTVKFNLYGNAREETGAYLATKEYVEAQNKPVNEYIDVRVDNRVYYR